MKKWALNWIVSTSALAIPSMAIGTVTATFPSGGGTATVTNLGGGHYAVTLHRDNTVAGAVEAIVTGAGSDIVDTLLVETNNAVGETRVHVRGMSASTTIDSLGSMTKSGTGPVVLYELLLAGDLGSLGSFAVSLDSIQKFVVGGTVYGDISLVNTSFTSDTIVGGDFLGDLTVSNGSITHLPVAGSFGPSGPPYNTVTIGGNVLYLTAHTFGTNMTVAGSIQTMEAITPGPSDGGAFAGSLTAANLAVVSGSTGSFTLSSGFYGNMHIANDVSIPVSINIMGNASLTIVGDVEALMTIGESYFADIYVGGSLTSTMRFFGPRSNSSTHIENDVAATGVIDFSHYMETAQDLVVGRDVAGQILFGTLAAGFDFNGTLEIGRDLTGTVHVIRSPLDDGGSCIGAISVGRYLSGRLLIDKYLASGAELQIGAASSPLALTGQVTIGASGGGSWLGDIFVNTTEILGPYYWNLSAQLGGGAIGVAPFHVFPADSTIADGGRYFRPGSSTHALPNPMRIRHYGPFQMAGVPKVYVQDPYDSTKWGDVSNLFTVSREGSTGILARTLKVTYVGMNGAPIPPGNYRVSVEDGELVCLDVGEGDTSVAPYDYYFTVGFDCDSDGTPDSGDFLAGPHNPSIDCDRNGVDDGCDLSFDAAFRDTNNNNVLDTCETGGPCACDFNGDTYLNSQDFFDFLTCLFSTNPLACGADFNANGTVDSQDFFDWLMCFFGGC